MTDKEKKENKIRCGNAIRAAVFLCLIACVCVVCFKVFSFQDPEMSNVTFDQFYELEDDTVDCVMIGTSVMMRDFVVPVAYHDQGVAAYSLTCGAQPFVMTRYLMEEALKTQDPKVFVVDIKGSGRTPEQLKDYGFRKMIDNMKPSMTKFRAIKRVVDYSKGHDNGVDETGLSYYMPILQYHSLWNPDKRPEYNGMDYYKGYAVAPNMSFRVKGIDPLPVPTEKMDIPPEAEETWDDLLDYCDTIDSDVLFTISPYEATDEGMKRLNYIKAKIEDRGYELLDFRSKESMEAVGIDNEYCFYDNEHLNYYASLIYTDWLAGYLKDKYDLPDRRGDKRYASWEEEYQRLQNNMEDGLYADRYSEMMGKIREHKSDVQ